jgi:hypothetical protein
VKLLHELIAREHSARGFEQDVQEIEFSRREKDLGAVDEYLSSRRVEVDGADRNL